MPALHAELEQRLQSYTLHMRLMQRRAPQQLLQSEQQRIQIQCEFDRMRFVLNDLRRQTSG